ncbi:MAG: DUF4192 domain-containing protein [Actinomycetota bacterium]|nr:DUF4192 domain-containing protein [Actinomycetota bacterium]
MDERNQTVLRVGGYDDLLAVVPYRLGFHPADSLVVLTLQGPRQRVGVVVRLDLPPLEHVDAVAESTVALLAEQRSRRVVVVVYAAEDTVAGPLVGAVRARLDQAGIDLADACRADGRRWFSYTCAEACCPAAGTPYDVASHPLAAQCVLAGQVALDSRDELRGTVAPLGGITRQAMDQAYVRVRPELQAQLSVPGADRRAALRRHATEVRRTVESYVAEPRRLRDDEVARLSIQVSAIPVRDTAWALMCRATAERHLSLWQQVLRRSDRDLVPAVACLTAFAAWLAGHGALAWCAVERAQEVDPSYSWAALLAEALARGISPRVWTAPPEALLHDLAG